MSYTPLHWLAYWNDVESIHYLLNLIPETLEDYKKIMKLNFSGLTPLDIAGQHMCTESALMIIEHMTERFGFIEEIFEQGSNS